MAIEVGNKLKGKVAGITNFGAFIELPDGTTGLVHISEVSDSYVKDINEVLKVGDEIDVKVINLDNNKVGLSIKKAIDKPMPQQRTKYRGGRNSTNKTTETPETFDAIMSKFLKDSEERQSSLKRSTETKRGGRGGRRG